MNDIIVTYDEPTPLPSGAVDFSQAWNKVPRVHFLAVPRVIAIKICADASAPTVADGAFIFEVPQELDGGTLTVVRAFVSTVSTSGTPVNVQVRNITNAVDILTTACTIDNNEYSSDTASTPPVVNPNNAIFKNRDRIAIDVDAIGSGAQGLTVYLTIQ